MEKYGDAEPIIGFAEGEVDPGKGFTSTQVGTLDEWNAVAFEQAAQMNKNDPFERKDQRVKLRTRVRLAIRNWFRSRKLGIDV